MSATRRLVLIHGFTERPSMWDKLIHPINDPTLAISTPSIPGHGALPEIPDELSAESYCRAIAEQLPHDDLPWIVVGHSMGGYLAATLARMFPERITALGFFHSKAGADNVAKIEDRKRAIVTAEHNKDLYLGTMLRNTFSEKTIERYREQLTQMIADAQQDISYSCVAAAHAVMIERADGVSTINNANYPVAYFLGTDDKSVSFESLQSELDEIKRAQITLIENVGHMGHIECFEEAAQWLKKLCAEN
jgi:pimeloyl-ACP methyl ester carboxylesterase